MHLLLLPVALLLVVSLSVAVPDECAPVKCGNHTVSFPFWVEDIQPPSCGMPNFKVNCTANIPLLIIWGLLFIAKSIDYSGTALIVSPLYSVEFLCFFFDLWNFDVPPYVLASSNNYLGIYKNCFENFTEEVYWIKMCGGFESIFVGRLDRGCRQVFQIPTLASNNVDPRNWEKILEDGIPVTWYAANCSKCQMSGGKCRYNLDDDQYACLCGNQHFASVCEGSGEITSSRGNLNGETTSSKNRGSIILGVTLAGVFGVSFLLLLGYITWKKRYNPDLRAIRGDGSAMLRNINDSIHENGELIHFDFVSISLATKNFSPENKIGAGGFGDVYKGILQDGKTIAVKRISLQSEERINEFMMELHLIAKLQHRNLVRLLGCCIEGGKRLLVYEFVPNKSLDFFIFGNEEKRLLLDWEKRLSIIMGVARGLLYLHQDSRLRVIHRDLKAANILLEEDMNPKISDFGTARVFERQQIDDNTIKIVGTIGYMSPEYIMSGIYSEKSDVFRFGVLVLEILSGRRNKWISQKKHCMELLATAWTLCMDQKIHELLDRTLSQPTQMETVIKFLRVGLLCVQEDPDDRPTMQEVVLMLGKDDTMLAQPKSPGFFQPTSFSFNNYLLMSPRELTVTNLEGR